MYRETTAAISLSSMEALLMGILLNHYELPSNMEALLMGILTNIQLLRPHGY